jgi:hypothetical protein
MVLAAAVAARADDWNKTFQVTATPSVVVDASEGSIEVFSVEALEVSASVYTRGWRIADDEVQVKAQQNGNRIEITVSIPSHARFATFSNRSIRISVKVPATSDLDLRSKDGHLLVDGVKGNHRLYSGDGRIEARGLDGKLKAETRDGSMRVDGRFDQLDLNTGDGKIEADVKTGSRMSAGWSVRTGDGSVTLRLPQDFAADLTAHTGDGRVTVDLPLTVSGSLRENEMRGKLNGGGYPLEVRTGDGSIRLARY